MKDLKEVTANDVQSYWRCSCGRLSVKLEDGQVITLFNREKRKIFPKLDLRRVFYNGISATCSACRDDIKPLDIDTTKLTASDISQYWHCKCGNLFIQLPDGRIIKLKTDEKPEKLPNLNLRHVTYLGIVPSCQDCRKL